MSKLWPLNLLSLLFFVQLLSYSLSLELCYILNSFFLQLLFKQLPLSLQHRSQLCTISICLFFKTVFPSFQF